MRFDLRDLIIWWEYWGWQREGKRKRERQEGRGRSYLRRWLREDRQSCQLEAGRTVREALWLFDAGLAPAEWSGSRCGVNRSKLVSKKWKKSQREQEEKFANLYEVGEDGQKGFSYMSLPSRHNA